jgi:hypothetical protein
VRERWFGVERDMGLWVLREIEVEGKRGKRDLGVMVAMGVGEEERERKEILIVCGKFF